MAADVQVPLAPDASPARQKFWHLTDQDRDELKIWWAIVWPCWVTYAAMGSMDMTDLTFLGHLGDGRYLAPASSAGIVLVFTATVFVRGPCGAMTVLSANAYGAGQSELAGRRLQVGIFYSIVLALLLAPTWAFPGNFINLLSVEGENVDVDNCNLYGRLRIFGLLPLGAGSVLQAWMGGRQKVLPGLYAAVLSCITNITLNAVLIHGLGWGFPGSPIATAISRWVMLFAMVGFSWADIQECWPQDVSKTFSKPRMVEFLQLCVPLTLSGLAEELNMQITAVGAARLGQLKLATHSCMLTCLGLLCTAMYAFATANNTRVSQLLVTGDLPRMKRLLMMSGVTLFAWSMFIMIIFFTLQSDFGKIFSKNSEVWELCGQLSFVVGGVYSVMSLEYLSMSTLQGMAKPSMIMTAFVIGGYLVGLPLSFWLAFSHSPDAFAGWPHYVVTPGTQGCGLLGLWFGLATGYAVATVLLTGATFYQLNRGEALVNEAQRMAELEQARNVQLLAAAGNVEELEVPFSARDRMQGLDFALHPLTSPRS